MAKRRGPTWIDATMEFGHRGGTWPGDAVFEVAWTARLGDRGGLGVNLSRITSSPHNGTHADAPYHVLEDGHRSEAFPLEPFIGPCLVVGVPKDAGDLVRPDVAAAILRQKPERVLFRTRTGPPPAAFPRKFTGLHPNLVEDLVRSGVRLIGTDAPSVDRADLQGLEAHRTLFRAGAYNLENLDLSRLEPGPYELYAPPLKVTGLCAAPVRALLRPA
jgi:arylformamidase